MRTSRFFGPAICALLFGALVWSVARRPLQHDDLFFHLHTGELIAKSGRIPHTDPFSFTLPGARWTTHEWGFALASYALYALGGYPALVHSVQALVLAIFVVVCVGMQSAVRAGRTALIAPLSLLGLFAAERACIVLRAALVSTLALAILCVLLQRYRREPSRKLRLAIGTLFVFWANLHASVVFGLVVLGLHALGPIFDQLRVPASDARLARIWRAGAFADLGWTLACAALTLLNPNGFALWTFPFELDRLLYHSGIDWQLGIFERPALARYPGFYLLIAVSLAACLPLARLRAALRSRRQAVLGQGLSALLFLALSLRSNRFILDFSVLALLFCASLWGDRLEGTDEHASAHARARTRWFARPATAHLANAGLMLGLLAWYPAGPQPLIDVRFSPPALDFMQRHALAGRMFNPEAWGGYLSWRLRAPIYWDGRNDVFGPLAIEYAHSDAATLIARHGLTMLVLDAVYHKDFAGYLRQHHERFGLVYFDDYLAVYVARSPEQSALLQRFEYRALRPFEVPSDAELHALADPTQSALVETELARLLAQNPQTSFAWYLRGRLAEQQNDADATYAALQRAARILPRAETYFRLASAENNLGRTREARETLARALALTER